MQNGSLLGVSTEGFHHLAYTEWGSPNSVHPTVICAHGYSRNSRDFDDLATYLSNKGRQVFCPDVVGRGESGWFKDGHLYNFPQYLSDMNALIARTQADSIDWIGTSMGGIIGMMLASLPNSPIHQLVLNDIGAQIPLYGLRRIAKYANQNPQFKSLEEAKAYYKLNYADFGITTEKQWDKFVQNSIRESATNVYVSKVDPKISTHKSTSTLVSEFLHHPQKALEGILYDIDLWSFWKNIHCPVLIIHGERSDILTPEIIRDMQRVHKHTQVYTISDAGHAPALLRPMDHEMIYNFLS